MALSFGNLVPSTTASNPLAMPLQVTGSPTASRATNRPPLSFGSSVPKMTDVYRRADAQPLTYGSTVTRRGSVSDLFNVGDFLKTASFGELVGDTRNNPAVYDDAILRASRTAARPIPQVHTATIDGGASISSALKAGIRGVLGSIGSSGDGEGELVPVAFDPGGGGGNNTMLWVIGGLAAAGIAYIALK